MYETHANYEYGHILKEATDTTTYTVPFDLDLQSTTCWNNIQLLQSHYSSWSDSILSNWKKSRAFIVKLLLDVDLLLPNEDDDFVMHLISKIESNCFGLFNEKGVCMGRAIYPLASYFNVLLLLHIYTNI
jgi:hypothetical protein